MSNHVRWLAMQQLLDSSLPIGGFSHSFGLETMVQDGRMNHPSQLYEAGLEGITLFLLLFVATRFLRSLKTPGLTSGIFVIGYAVSRIFVEFFREPDAQLGYLAGTDWLTMGMILSSPMILLGIWAIARARRAADRQHA